MTLPQLAARSSQGPRPGELDAVNKLQRKYTKSAETEYEVCSLATLAGLRIP